MENYSMSHKEEAVELLIQAQKKISLLEEDNKVLRMHVSLLEQDHCALTELYSKVQQEKTNLSLENEKLRKKVKQTGQQESATQILDQESEKESEKKKMIKCTTMIENEKDDEEEGQIFKGVSLEKDEKNRKSFSEKENRSISEIQKFLQKAREAKRLEKMRENNKIQFCFQDKLKIAHQKVEENKILRREEKQQKLLNEIPKNKSTFIYPRIDLPEESQINQIIQDFSQDFTGQKRMNSPLIRKNGSYGSFYRTYSRDKTYKATEILQENKKFNYTNWRKGPMTNNMMIHKAKVNSIGGKHIILNR